MAKCLNVKEAHETKLLKKQNVVGTAIGEKWVNGTSTGKDAVLVFVQKKFSKRGVINKYSTDEIIPSELDGVPTDVIEVGIITKETGHRGKVRPVQPGYSVGHKGITAGTIGGFFRDKDGDPVFLSNNHVLANENSAKNGDLIYQPGPLDNRANLNNVGWPNPVTNLPYIGTLKRFVRLRGNGNSQDSAIAKIHPSLIRDGLISDIYPTINKRLQGFSAPKVGLQVQKEGRTTGYTTGRVMGLHATFSVGYDFGPAKFNNCVVLSNMSKGGDSGSIIFDMNMKAVALLFAGSPRVTIANPIALVQQHYGLTPWSGSSKPDGTIDIGGINWVEHNSRGTKISKNKNGVIQIEAPANRHCYYESAVSGRFNSAYCVVNTGSDGGATWGPGLVVQWPNGMLKVNLRKSSFGGYYNTNYRIDVGRTKRNKAYPVRIRKTAQTWIGEVQELRKWHAVIEVPLSVFPHDPIAVRVGKTGTLGHSGDHGTAGKKGKCSISGFKIT
jgi:hypothetical protein